jgi:hypothetical protein
MPTRLPVLLFSLCLLYSCGNPAGPTEESTKSQAIFAADFAQVQGVSGWVETGLQADAAVDTLATFPEASLVLQGVRVCKSPQFPIEALTYYQLDFDASATHKTMWALVFWDKNGTPLLADVYSSIDPVKKPQAQRFFFQAKADAVTAQLWFQNVTEEAQTRITQATISPLTDPRAYLSWADSVYAEMPQLAEVSAPAEREQMIPRTLAALRKGEKVRVVMLGNSIINDTGNSGWEIPLEAAYPGADIEVITSVRGGTGCWYYQENNRVDPFVIRYEPDLLIIGGISHRNDTAAIHAVIRQVRAKSNPEILVLSGPVGRQGDPRSDSTFHIPPTGDDFRLHLQTMAQAAGVGYIDMKTDWGTYIQASGKPYDYFLRDPVHANARGRQVLARLMYGYFAP